jgi:hypothetical protein
VENEGSDPNENGTNKDCSENRDRRYRNLLNHFRASIMASACV